MKIVENLFPEFCNIYAESYNTEYLARCSDRIQLRLTNHRDLPAFVTGDVDLVYLGCSPERKQEQIIELLRPHLDRIRELIDRGTVFLVTGNAVEIFGREIRDGDRVIPALGLFDFYSVRYMDRDRHNSQYIAAFTGERGEEITLLGHRSQFSFSYGDFSGEALARVEVGIGMNPDTKDEGLRRNHFFGTYSLGPYLIMNPPFTKYLLRLMGLEDRLCFEAEAMEAYEYRRDELRRTLH
jgi:CobQ-like glutamine amidotransferase family enzyme